MQNLLAGLADSATVFGGLHVLDGLLILAIAGSPVRVSALVAVMKQAAPVSTGDHVLVQRPGPAAARARWLRVSAWRP